MNVYKASRAYEDLEQMLGLRLTYLNVHALRPLVDIRNRAVHEGQQPGLVEATYVNLRKN